MERNFHEWRKPLTNRIFTILTCLISLTSIGCEGSRLENRAKAGDLQAMFEYARYLDLHSEYGNWANRETSFRWFERAAKAGHPAAMLKYGRLIATSYLLMSQTGNNCSWMQYAAKTNPDAFQWFEKAAQAGDAEAQLELATIYQTGSWQPAGIPKDLAKADYWRTLAYAQFKAPPVPS